MTAAALANSLRLTRREYRELDALSREHLQSVDVDGGFRKPHAFGEPAKSVLEVLNAPFDLRLPIAGVRERQNHVVVSLRDRGAETREPFAAHLVRDANRLVRFRRLRFYPGKQRRSKIEADLRIIVHQLHDALLMVQNPLYPFRG